MRSQQQQQQARLPPKPNSTQVQLRSKHDLITDSLAASIDFDKKDWLRVLKSVKRDYATEDKERWRPLLNLKKELKEFYEEVEKEERKGDIAIKKEFSQIVTQIHKHRGDVEQAKTMIVQARTDPNTLDRLHTKVKGIESNLKQFKLKSRGNYEQLAEEEEQLRAEMNMWEAKFEAYAAEKNPVSDIIAMKKPSGTMTGPRSSSVGKQHHQKSRSSSEVVEIQDQADDDELSHIRRELDKCDMQLQKNGALNCGWDAGDHKDFLRIRTQHNNKTNTMAFMTELMRAVPGLDDEKVQEHIRAYDLYLMLTDSKKQLLFQYKEAKKKAQKDRVSKMDTQTNLYSRMNEDLDLMSSNQSKENLQSTNAADKQALKEHIDKWRKDKDQASLKEKEEKKARELQTQIQNRQRIEEEGRMKREQLEEYKFRRELEKQREKQIEEMEKRKKREQVINQEQRERIWKREEDIFIKKHQLIIQKQINKEEHEMRMEQVYEKVTGDMKDRVGSRLNQETKAMKDKKRDKFDENKDQRRDAMTMGGNVLGVSVRAMPMWRQGI